MNLVRILILLASASFCVGLMVWHAWKIRGRNIAMAFFLSCTVYAVIRGKMVYLLTVGITDSGFPYIFSEQLIKIFNEPVMTIVGWNFAIYLSWCLAELIMGKLRIRRSNVFALSVFAFLICASISYVVESAAGKANWWQWGMSTKNNFFADVPVVGIVDWAAIISDFLLPFLLFIDLRTRKYSWRYLLFLPFAFHMFSHSPLLNNVPVLFTFFHVLIFLIPLYLALYPPRLFRAENSPETESIKEPFRIFSASNVPFFSWLILILVTVGVQLVPDIRPDGFISFGPILMIGALAFLGLRGTFILSPIILVLSLVHDFRWLAALANPLTAFLVGYALLDRKKEVNETKKTLPGPKFFKACALTLFLLLSVWATAAGVMLRMESDRYTTSLQDFLSVSANQRNFQAELDKLVDSAPAEATFLMKIAEILTEKKAPPAVIMAHLKKAIEVDPRYILPYDALGLIRYETGDFDGAIKILNDSLKYRVSEPGPYINMASVYSARGEFEKAIEYSRKAVDMKPGNAAAWNELGKSLAGKGSREEAVSAFQKAVEIDSEYRDAWFNLGIACDDGGMTDPALENYRKAVQLDPEYAPALFNIGNLLQKSGKTDEAKEYFQKTINVSPDYAEAWLSLGLIAFENDEFMETISYCDKFLEIAPQHNRAYFVHYLLGRSLYETGEIGGAADNFRKAIRLRGNWPQVSSQLARILALHPDKKIRNIPEAEQLAMQAVNLTGGGQPEALDTLAMVMAASGQFDEAVEFAERAVKIAHERGNENLADEIQSRLDLYKNKRKYRSDFPLKK